MKYQEVVADPNFIGNPSTTEYMDTEFESKKRPVPDEMDADLNEHYNDVSSLQRTYDFVHYSSWVTGWFFVSDWRPNLMFYLTIVMNIFKWVVYIHSQILYVTRGEFERIFEVFALYGITISFSIKIIMFINSHKEMAALRNFTYKISREAGRHMAAKFDEVQAINLKLVKTVTCVAIFSVTVYGIGPIKAYMDSGVIISLLPVEFFFLPQSNWLTFVLANMIMVAMGVWTSISLLAIIYYFSLVICNCSIQAEVIADDLRQLDGFWDDPSTTTVHYRRMFLRNVCIKCQDKNNYMGAVKKIFDQPLYYYFCFSYTSQVICLYEVKVNHWAPGAGIACGVFLEMLLYCMIGTKSASVNEQIVHVLQQSNWYTYDLHSQHLFLHLLKSSMNAKELWIGPLAPLSASSAVQIVKSIYTYYTFLAEAA